MNSLYTNCSVLRMFSGQMYREINLRLCVPDTWAMFNWRVQLVNFGWSPPKMTQQKSVKFGFWSICDVQLILVLPRWLLDWHIDRLYTWWGSCLYSVCQLCIRRCTSQMLFSLLFISQDSTNFNSYLNAWKFVIIYIWCIFAIRTSFVASLMHYCNV
jgi:hypothetical protein